MQIIRQQKNSKLSLSPKENGEKDILSNLKFIAQKVIEKISK